VLVQILLEMDDFKLDLLPAGLLHEMIRSSDTLVHEFVETYFSEAFDWFMRTREAMDQQLRQAVGLRAEEALSTSNPPEQRETPRKSGPADAEAEDLRSNQAASLQARVDRLTERVEQLQSRLAAASSTQPATEFASESG